MMELKEGRNAALVVVVQAERECETAAAAIILARGKLDDATAVTARSQKEVDDAATAAEQAQAECNAAMVTAEQARAERDEVVARTVLLSKSLADLQEGARHLRSLEEAHRGMMQDLAVRGKVLCERFGAELQVPPAYQEEDPASHAHFFIQLVKELETMVPRQDGLVEAECRQLLSAAAMQIFSNF